MSAFGPKRTRAVAPHMSAFGGESGHDLLRRKCQLMTQSVDICDKLSDKVHFPIFVLTAFSSFAQPTLTSFSCCLRQPINLPPPGGMPLHSLATSSLQ